MKIETFFLIFWKIDNYLVQALKLTFKIFISFLKQTKSYCGCPQGFVLWKWRCFRSAYQIHDPCIVSVQCQEGQVCHPLSNVCSCPFGISNCTKTMKATENPTKVTRYDDDFWPLQLNRQ